jgi:hypothetical protein
MPRRGSIGLVVRDLEPHANDSDDRVILTAAHTFPKGVGAAVMVAPPSHGLLPTPADGAYFGTVRRRQPLYPPYSPCSVDAAIIKPEPGLTWEHDNRIDGRAPTGIRDLFYPAPDEYVPVFKVGAASGLTRGFLEPVVTDQSVWGVEQRYTCGWLVYGDGCQFAAPGDSGAILVDADHNVVGMAVAIDSPQLEPSPAVGCFAHGIRQIFSALGVELLGG